MYTHVFDCYQHSTDVIPKSRMRKRYVVLRYKTLSVFVSIIIIIIR